MIRRLSILELSDRFRQMGAVRSTFDATMVEQGLFFAARTTFLVPEYRKINWVNKDALEGLRDIGFLMADEAKENGYSVLVLPYDARSPLGKWVDEEVCKPLSSKFNLTVRCQRRRFYPNYQNVDPNIRTCLDEGIRGVANVAPPWEPKRRFAA